MKLEIEAKIRVGDYDLVMRRLAELQAVAQTIVWEEDVYFGDDAGVLSRSDSGLRLRKRIIKGKGEQFILTFKGPRQQSAFKSRSETETGVANYEAMHHILEQLGYQKRLRVEKKRHIWRLDECEICLDDVASLGKFVEIEGPTETAVASVVQKLGLDQSELITEGYAQMIAKSLHRT
jgi:adenylate cyclase class 2